MSKCGVISGPYFSVLGLNREICGVNIWIQSEYRKIRTRNDSVLGHFIRSAVSSLKLIKRGFSVEGKIYEMKTFIYDLYEIKTIMQHDNKHKNIG